MIEKNHKQSELRRPGCVRTCQAADAGTECPQQAVIGKLRGEARRAATDRCLSQLGPAVVDVSHTERLCLRSRKTDGNNCLPPA